MKKRKNNCILITAISIAIIIIFIILSQTKKMHRDAIQLNNGTMLPVPYKIKSFQLVDQNDDPFTNSNLNGHWSIIFFGFTRCPMMCPTTLSTLNKMYRMLKKKGVENNLPKVIFISVDPEYDKPDVIKKYLQSFNSNFIGVTGTKAEIKNLTKQLGIAYIKEIKSGNPDYEIDHSGTLIIINPSGKWEALINPPHFNAEIIVKDFERIQKSI